MGKRVKPYTYNIHTIEDKIKKIIKEGDFNVSLFFFHFMLSFRFFITFHTNKGHSRNEYFTKSHVIGIPDDIAAIDTTANTNKPIRMYK